LEVFTSNEERGINGVIEIWILYLWIFLTLSLKMREHRKIWRKNMKNERDDKKVI